MVDTREKYRNITFIEAFHWMKYLEEHYGTDVEVHFYRREDGPRNAVLCIAGARGCILHRECGSVAVTEREIPYQELHTVPGVLYEMFFEFCEMLDGQCPRCLEFVVSCN